MTEVNKGQKMSNRAGEISKASQTCWARLRSLDFRKNQGAVKENIDANICLRGRDVHFGFREEHGLGQSKSTSRKII